MEIRISNKDIHRYKYIRRKKRIKGRVFKESKISFGEVFYRVKELKDKGIISVSSVNASISKAVKKTTNKKVH